MKHGQRKQDICFTKVIEYLKDNDDKFFDVLDFYQGELGDGINCLYKSASDSLIYLVDQIDSVEIVRTIMKEFAQQDKSKYIAYRDGHLYTFNSVLEYIETFNIDVFGVISFAFNDFNNYCGFPEDIYRIIQLYNASFEDTGLRVLCTEYETRISLGNMSVETIDYVIEALQRQKEDLLAREEE